MCGVLSTGSLQKAVQGPIQGCIYTHMRACAWIITKHRTRGCLCCVEAACLSLGRGSPESSTIARPEISRHCYEPAHLGVRNAVRTSGSRAQCYCCLYAQPGHPKEKTPTPPGPRPGPASDLPNPPRLCQFGQRNCGPDLEKKVLHLHVIFSIGCTRSNV